MASSCSSRAAPADQAAPALTRGRFRGESRPMPADAALPDAWPATLLGLIGAGIGASLTPAMHEREGA